MDKGIHEYFDALPESRKPNIEKLHSKSGRDVLISGSATRFLPAGVKEVIRRAMLLTRG